MTRDKILMNARIPYVERNDVENPAPTKVARIGAAVDPSPKYAYKHVRESNHHRNTKNDYCTN